MEEEKIHSLIMKDGDNGVTIANTFIIPSLFLSLSLLYGVNVVIMIIIIMLVILNSDRN